MSANQEHFQAVLKAEFAPRLREAGFKGSGRNFNRVVGDVIHAINLQGNKWGGSCILNLGIHLSFLPDTLGAMWEPRKMKEFNCEFRTRVGSPIHADHWWAYGNDPASDEASARSLVQTYFNRGEAHFLCFSQPSAILGALERMVFAPDTPGPKLAERTTVRTALAGARIQRHNGNLGESQRFAQVGLSGIGLAPFAAGVALKPELEALAKGG